MSFSAFLLPSIHILWIWEVLNKLKKKLKKQLTHTAPTPPNKGKKQTTYFEQDSIDLKSEIDILPVIRDKSETPGKMSFHCCFLSVQDPSQQVKPLDSVQQLR